MMLSNIFNKVQKLDNKIKILSEMTPGIEKRPIPNFLLDNQYNNQKQNKQQYIIEKVNQLEKLVSNLKI